MGLGLYTEDQVHERTYVDGGFGVLFTRVVAAAAPGSLLNGVSPHGDTMFNIPQLNRIESEFDDMLGRHPELADDVAALRVLFEAIRRKRGYLWVCGD
ncbi:hypothetical protein [Actinokineospora pegani]|uniref:hypothetical protein n=1 Tax=Actinokineospora pegani TaxID=2654637 RepID=UPI0012EAE962|nr:hypothetical protein [Actinokineospora pegani]